MIEFLIIIGLAFYWLMIETKWLTIRLERTPKTILIPKRGEIDITGLISMAIGMIYLAVGFVLTPIRIYRSHTYTQEQHEADMANLWKRYGRKQPKLT